MVGALGGIGVEGGAVFLVVLYHMNAFFRKRREPRALRMLGVLCSSTRVGRLMNDDNQVGDQYADERRERKAIDQRVLAWF
jgi:hypothetical protein